MHLAELQALRRPRGKQPSARCSGQPSSNVTYIYIHFVFLNSLLISLLEERSAEPGLRNAALVYKAPSH